MDPFLIPMTEKAETFLNHLLLFFSDRSLKSPIPIFLLSIKDIGVISLMFSY